MAASNGTTGKRLRTTENGTANEQDESNFRVSFLFIIPPVVDKCMIAVQYNEDSSVNVFITRGPAGFLEAVRDYTKIVEQKELPYKTTIPYVFFHGKKPLPEDWHEWKDPDDDDMPEFWKQMASVLGEERFERDVVKSAWFSSNEKFDFDHNEPLSKIPEFHYMVVLPSWE